MPGRIVKKQQEQISPNHLLRLILSSVAFWMVGRDLEKKYHPHNLQNVPWTSNVIQEEAQLDTSFKCTSCWAIFLVLGRISKDDRNSVSAVSVLLDSAAARSTTVLGQKVGPRLRESCREVQAEVISKSSNKIHQIWVPPFSRTL